MLILSLKIVVSQRLEIKSDIFVRQCWGMRKAPAGDSWCASPSFAAAFQNFGGHSEVMRLIFDHTFFETSIK
jgi:hypothetical protein